MSQKYAAYDTSGNINAYYDSVDSPVPSGVNAIKITDGQWQTCLTERGWTVDTSSLSLVSPTSAYLLQQAKTAQIAIINSAAIAAEQADLSFTTAAGVTATFGMGADQQRKYLGAYTRYVVHAVAVPSGFSFIDSAGAAVAFTEADIDNFATSGFDQVEAALTKQASLVAEINAATTISAVQAVTW